MKTILVVDDSPVIRSVVQIYLRERPYQFVEAEHGRKALEILRAGVPVDLVLADIGMPVIDGVALVEQIRGDPEPRLRSLPIVLMTGGIGRRTPKLGPGGADVVIAKPLSGAKLSDAIDKLLETPAPNRDSG